MGFEIANIESFSFCIVNDVAHIIIQRLISLRLSFIENYAMQKFSLYDTKINKMFEMIIAKFLYFYIKIIKSRISTRIVKSSRYV